MSNELAIAAVTAVLKNLLDNGTLEDAVVSATGAIKVTAQPPDLIELKQDSPSQLNLFLFQATPNAGWRNERLPSRDAGGERISNPYLALDLHYMLTAYASRDLHAEILLGYGMQILHEVPVLPRERIRRALGPPGPVADSPDSLPPALKALASSGLAEQIELIKITPATLEIEAVSQIWSALQSRYRPTAVYRVSVTLIEPRRSTRSSLPVAARRIYAVPFREPRIDRLLVRKNKTGPAVSGPITVDDRLVIRGRRLRGESTRLRVTGVEVTPDSTVVADDAIEIDVPVGLQAGVQSVQVLHDRLMGEPPVAHTGVTSNLAAFVLHPKVTPPATATSGGTMQLTLDPPVGPGQSVVLLLNELQSGTDPPQPRAYSFVAPPRPPLSPPEPSAQVDVPIAAVDAADYLVRARVDGADSPLTADGTGRYGGPKVTIS